MLSSICCQCSEYKLYCTLVLAGNSAWFWILHNYTYSSRPSLCAFVLCTCFSVCDIDGTNLCWQLKVVVLQEPSAKKARRPLSKVASIANLVKDTPLRHAKNSLKVHVNIRVQDKGANLIDNSEFFIGIFCVTILFHTWKSTWNDQRMTSVLFSIIFLAFNQLLSRSCPLPFLEIPSPIHSQKCVHHQEKKEDQSQATPPSGTDVHICTTPTCKDVMRCCALHVRTCLYTDVI